jgi:hypothetical protein
MNLHLADKFNLPPEAVTQTFAILARRGAGKSYTASVMAEEMQAAHLHFVILDPTGAWWGLRATADGKPLKDSALIIIGGEHGDLPLESSSGKIIADLVVEHPGQYLLDLSATTSNAEQDRFVTEFAERLYRRKATAKSPLHLFLDEADSFAPQRPMPGQQRMLGAIESIVRRGRIRGLGVTLITQRAAVLNKNVLTQTECLVVMQITAPQDIAAVQDWVRNNSTPKECEKVMASLASMQRGDAWVWSPSWLRTLERVKIRRRRSFDSGATPELGARQITVKLAPADLEKIKDKIAATIERAKGDDPRELRKRIAQLESEKGKLSNIKIVERGAVKIVENRVEVKILTAAQIAKLDSCADRAEKAAKRFELVAGGICELLGKAAQENHNLHNARAKEIPQAPATPLTGGRGLRWQTKLPMARTAGKITESVRPRGRPIVQKYSQDNGTSIVAGARKILIAIAQHSEGVDRDQLSVLVGLKRSSRDTYLQRLRADGLVDTNGSRLTCTQEGIDVIGTDFEPLPTGTELRDHWLRTLPNGEKLILQQLLRVYPNALTNDQLLNLTPFKRSSIGTYLQKLNARRLIVRNRAESTASETLFDGGQ